MEDKEPKFDNEDSEDINTLSPIDLFVIGLGVIAFADAISIVVLFFYLLSYLYDLIL